MKLRIKLAVLPPAIALAAAGWAWTVGADALDGRGPAQPIGAGTVTFEQPEMARPFAGELPSAGVSGLFWISQDDLTFHPVVPCRVVDTRAPGSHGILASTEVYSFNVVATNYSTQGGLAGSCGIPNRALAVEVNVLAANPTAAGFLKLYPFIAEQPNASILNYSTGQNIANSATVGRCADADGGLCYKDLTLYAHTSTHLIVDVLGYYEAPLSVQVDASGSVYGASLGVYFVEHFSPGSYGVHFYRDVSTCAFSATAGWGDSLSTGAVFVEAEDLFESPDGVYVVTRNSSGVPTDEPFQLVAHC